MGLPGLPEDFAFLDLISYCTSILTIVACFIMKIPQILNLYNKKSTGGININALLMELIRSENLKITMNPSLVYGVSKKGGRAMNLGLNCFENMRPHWQWRKSIDAFYPYSYTITAVYNFVNGYKLLTYMEYPIILIQQVILIMLVLKYQHRLTDQSVRFAAIWYTLLVSAFMSNVMPSWILTYLVPLTTPVSGMSKCVHMYAIIQAENADSISLLTWVISVATNLSRIFTVYMDSADRNLLFNFSVSTLLSSGVLATAIYYQRRCAPAIQEGRSRDD